MIKVVNITKKDYLEYSKFALNRVCKSNNQGTFGFFKSMIIWCVLTISFMVVFQIKSINLPSLHWQSVVLTAGVFSIVVIGYLFNINKFKKRATPNENGVMLGEKTIEFRPDGISETNRLGNCFYKWEAVEAIEEHNDNVYIFIDKLLALIVPASAFTSSEDKLQLKALLQKYL